MFLASAYPDSAISATGMTVIALVMAGCLAFWIGMVYIADRQPREKVTQPARGQAALVTAPGKTAEDGLSEAPSREEVPA